MNIENQMNPLPIDNVPFNSKENYSYYNSTDNNDDDVETADLMHLEPKLRDAWIKMRKLDKKLARLGKKEKRKAQQKGSKNVGKGRFSGKSKGKGKGKAQKVWQPNRGWQ
jgi:hypothetical protein